MDLLKCAKRYVVALGLVLFLACGASAAQEPVVLVDYSWDSVQFHNRITGFLLEHAFGMKPEGHL
jgi:glycine betaine/proline transport system substrate-binding protein